MGRLYDLIADWGFFTTNSIFFDITPWDSQRRLVWLLTVLEVDVYHKARELHGDVDIKEGRNDVVWAVAECKSSWWGRLTHWCGVFRGKLVIPNELRVIASRARISWNGDCGGHDQGSAETTMLGLAVPTEKVFAKSRVHHFDTISSDCPICRQKVLWGQPSSPFHQVWTW